MLPSRETLLLVLEVCKLDRFDLPKLLVGAGTARNSIGCSTFGESLLFNLSSTWYAKHPEREMSWANYSSAKGEQISCTIRGLFSIRLKLLQTHIA